MLEEEELKSFYEDCIEDIKCHIAMIMEDLDKSKEQTAASRRVRKTSIILQQIFKDYRKLSCKLGLK